MKVTVFPADQFHTFDWARCPAAEFSRGCWSIGRGGHGLPDETRAVSIMKSDGTDLDVE